MFDPKNRKKINRLNIALSVLVAFGTWFYVVTDISPYITKTYTDVEIECDGLDVLASGGMGVESMTSDSIRVRVKLDRADVAETNADDFRAVVDVSEAIRGDNICDVKVYGPSSQKIEWQSLESITVKVTDSFNHDVPVTAVFKDSNDSSREPVVSSMSSKYVSVMGAVSQSVKVAYVALAVDTLTASNDSNASYEGNSVGKPVAYDARGRIVKNIVIRPETVEVVYTAGSVITQVLDIEVTGNEEGKYEYQLPKSVVVKGEPKVLGALTKISGRLNVEGITEDTDVDIEYDLPKGVYIANKSLSSSVRVKVKK